MEKKNAGEKREKMFIVATSVVASRAPKKQPTGTPNALANKPLWSELL